jgi:hypothetical protein
MAQPTQPPGIEHANEHGVAHIPTSLPANTTDHNPDLDTSLPDAATDHMSPTAVMHIPDWLIS